MAAGIRVPQDVEVVAHANFPLKRNALPVPVMHFDIRQIFKACFENMTAQQRHEPVPFYSTVNAIFDSEVASEWSAQRGDEEARINPEREREFHQREWIKRQNKSRHLTARRAA